MIVALQNQKNSLVYELNNLTKTKQTIEATIRTDKTLIEQTLAKLPMNLKQQKPDLFYMTGADQIGALLKAILK
jgi:hypothetical protein